MLLQVLIVAEILLLTASYPTPNTPSMNILYDVQAAFNKGTEKSAYAIETLVSPLRMKRSSEETQTFYRITQYEHSVEDAITAIDRSAEYTTRPAEQAANNEYSSYLESPYDDDENCKPQSVMLHGNGDYLPDVVPGVRCKATCSACDDGYTYQAVMYPMPVLKTHRIGATQVYYKTTRSIPVYCTCSRDSASNDDGHDGNDDGDDGNATYIVDDSSNPYDGFDSLEVHSKVTKDPVYNEEETDDIYDAFDAKYHDVTYNAEETERPYDAFETSTH